MTNHQIASVNLRDGLVMIRWSDNFEQQFQAASLRHSPGFPDSKRPAAEAGRFPMTPKGFEPRDAELTETGQLKLTWQPGRVESVHQADWLWSQTKNPVAHNLQSPTIIQWNADSINHLSEHDYNAVYTSNVARLALLEQILDWGVALIRNVPPELNSVEQVAGWFGQIPPNPYADDPHKPALTSIRVDPAVPVATHMSHFLGPHTDTCWRQTLIGLLLMHCLQAHPQGGRSMLVDGFAVANRLREESLESFELLSTVPVNFDAKVEDRDDWRVMGRIISLAADGVVEGIRYNGNSIGQLDLPDVLIASMYAALEKFESILYDKSLWWRPLLQPGDLLVIDNHRVLHGREAFDPIAGERHIQCCNVDRDDFHNRYRRMAKSHGSIRWDQRFSAGVI